MNANTAPCPSCHTYCYGDCGYITHRQYMAPATTSNNTALDIAIEAAGYTCNMWQRGNMHRLYINDGRTSLGYVDMTTGVYHSQRREGTQLWTTLNRQNLING